jgi:hypothetical protein
MQIEGMEPEVKERLRELAQGGRPPGSRSIDEVIADYLENGQHDEWTVTTARRIFEEDAEFFRMLGGSMMRAWPDGEDLLTLLSVSTGPGRGSGQKGRTAGSAVRPF